MLISVQQHVPKILKQLPKSSIAIHAKTLAQERIVIVVVRIIRQSGVHVVIWFFVQSKTLRLRGGWILEDKVDNEIVMNLIFDDLILCSLWAWI